LAYRVAGVDALWGRDAGGHRRDRDADVYLHADSHAYGQPHADLDAYAHAYSDPDVHPHGNFYSHT
jgi:hypothetical protein